MTKRMTSQTRSGGSYQRSRLSLCAVAFFATSLLVGCGDSSNPAPKKDSATDQAKDTANTNALDAASDVFGGIARDVANDSPNLNMDLAPDAEGCNVNGQIYAVGATVTMNGSCPATCCLSNGTVGQCAGTCQLDATVPDTRPPLDVPPSDAPITCTRAGRAYNPGEVVPLADGCEGTCVCLTTGALGACTPACPVDAGFDLPKDANKDQSIYDVTPPVDVTPPIDTACVAGAACSLGNGNKGFCAAGACTACAGAADDTKCRTAYGTGNICISGACTAGDCHDSVGCSNGRLCGSSVAHACGDCTTDTQCTSDTHYGAGHLCVNNLCVPGNCHDTSADCPNLTPAKPGQVCGATTDHTCGACTSDTQCANDAIYAAAPVKPICTTTAGQTKIGQCVANPTTGTGNLCTSNSVVCPANSADFCCGNKCVPGNCCVDADCTTLGANFVCQQNSCTQCNSVVGNAYLVDPVDGDDTGGTGSGISGTTATAACSFRTLTKALDVITQSGTVTAPTGTTITIVGRTTGTTSLYTVAAGGVTAETLPIVVPTNITITTKTGPVKLTLGATTGFRLLSDNAGIMPVAAAPLAIDGASGSNVGIEVAPGTGNTVSLRYITVKDTGGDGIQVKSGTATFGTGIGVTGAGANGINISSTGAATMNSGLSVTTAIANGINISGTGAATMGAGVSVTGSGINGLNILGSGTATITVTSPTAASTVFDGNGHYGISVAGNGVLTINGATPTTGTAVRTISAKNNTDNNVNFASSSDTLSVIDHFYSYNSVADGLQIVAGSKIQVRHSVFRRNAGDGIHIVSSGSSDNLINIDLGTSATSATAAGNNELQSTATATKNTGAGLCVDLTLTTTPGQTLEAQGNQFAGIDCTTATPGPITKNATCNSGVDLGITAAGPTVTVSTLGCTHP